MTFCSKRCRLLLAGCAGFFASLALAQGPDKLPLAPSYRGEIRRSADGTLVALPEADVEVKRHWGDVAPKATMIVGPGERVATLTEAAYLARDGEVIEIRPGDYRGQTAVWTQDKLLIRGAGPRPVMLADGKSAEGKAIWVVRGGLVRIENIEFRGARVADGNGAGIRFEKGRLSVHACRFVDNEMGILTANDPALSLLIADSEFADAPRHAGDPHHLLYVGAIGKLVLRGSRFRNGHLGHLVKSRARENHVVYNLLADGTGGRASYELEFPNGGLAYVIGNLIGQSASTDNPSLIAYGAEGARWPDNALYLAHNTLLNDSPAGSFLTVAAERFAEGVEVWAINNLLVGNGNFFQPAQGRFEGNRAVARAELIEDGGVPARLTSHSALRGAVRVPGKARDVDLLPTAEFSFPVGSRPLRVSSMLAPGAFQ